MTDGPTPRRRFARIYFDDLEADYPSVFYDPTCLSTYVRLLVLSEKAWPALPEIPTSARRADLEKLQVCGMMDLLPNKQYALRGWVKDREVRAAHGRNAVAQRIDRSTPVPTQVSTPVSTPVVPAHAGGSPSTSISVVEEWTRARDDEPDAWTAFQRRTGEVPGPKFRKWLNELSEAHGEARLAKTIDGLAKTQESSKDYLYVVRDTLRAEDFEAVRAERQAEKAAVAEKRAPVKVIRVADDISVEEARRLAKEYVAEGRR